jgi:inner membrane protein
MIWSLGAKWYTYQIFEKNLEEKNIKYSRLMTMPTPMNTFLWSATADGDSLLYTGLYSIFDEDQNVVFHRVENKHQLVAKYQNQNDDVLNRLNFLSKGWYVINNDNPDTLLYNDARFGPMYRDGQPMYGFGYRLVSYDKSLNLIEQSPKPNAKEGKEMFLTLWNRIWRK